LSTHPDRRQILTWMTAATLVACAGGKNTNDDSAAAGSDTGDGDRTGDPTEWGSDGSCGTIPEETAGPYPADGSSGRDGTNPDVLSLDGIVRSDLRTSLGTGNTAAGVKLTIRLRIVASGTCAPLAGYAVYVWHANATGVYSQYDGASEEDYLRGVQVTDDDGVVSFTSVFPGCYSGRWPHVHFEVYASLADTSDSRNAVATSQLALPEATCDLVYATSDYKDSRANLAKISLATDNVFSDGVEEQTPAMSGSVDAGFVAALQVAVG
jgi:protocatechuate 3,4-dioxygenase beta subunit